MEKEDLEIKKASEELTAEDLAKENGGSSLPCDGGSGGQCNSYCPGKCPEHSSI